VDKENTLSGFVEEEGIPLDLRREKKFPLIF
jgi:hypothetical protein